MVCVLNGCQWTFFCSAASKSPVDDRKLSQTLFFLSTCYRKAEYLGLTITSLPERCFDLVVVGAGPATPCADGMIYVVIPLSAGRAGSSPPTLLSSNAPRARSDAFCASERPRMPVISSRS